MASGTLEPLCRYVDFHRRLRLAVSELERRLAALPQERWRIEPYPLTGERRNTLLVMGERGVFVISATYAPGHFDDVITVSRLARKIQMLLPGYPGQVQAAICFPFSSVRPRIWYRADDRGEWLGAWVVGGDSVIEWLEDFGPEHGLATADLHRFDELCQAQLAEVGDPDPAELASAPPGGAARPGVTAIAAWSRSARAAPGGDLRVDPLDLAGQLARDLGELPERAGDRAQRHALERLAEVGHGRIEALPQLRRTASRSAPRTQLVGELHVSGTGMGTPREAEKIRVAQRRGLLLGRVGDRADALRKVKVRRSLHACLERLAPALVGEPHLLDRASGVCAHDSAPGSGVTVMMWSAICRGAGGGEAKVSGSRAESASWRRYAGEASDISARSTSDRRTLQVRPTRTAAKRPLLTHARTVAGWIFSSSLTCCTVSHGSSPGPDLSGNWSGIYRYDESLRGIYQLDACERS